MSTADIEFEFSATVCMHEVGPNNTAPIQVLLRYFQEAAGLHAESLAWGIDNLMQYNLAWVMTRLTIEMDRFPGSSEALKVYTWPVSRVKYTARRDFRIVDAAGIDIARGATNWVMMDIDARRMKTIPDEFASMFDLEMPAPAITIEGKKIPGLVASDCELDIIARLEDLDGNGHVNNTHITAWMLEPVPVARTQQMQLKSLDIQFRAEVCRYERLRAQCGGETDSPVLLHSLVRESDGVEAARAKTVWTLL